MIDLTELHKNLALAVCASLAISAASCGSDSPGNQIAPDSGMGIPPPPAPVFSTRESRASTIAISEDNALIAMVNPDDGSLSVFQTSDNSRISKTPTGGNPSSVVIMGDSKTAYVANRGDATVVRITNIDGGKPTVDATVNVGAEPAGLALSPSGLKLFVAEFAESRVSVIDTTTMAITTSIAIDRPRAVVVTNNADHSDDDEQLVVSQYFGVPVPGRETKDDGRTGQVAVFPLTSLTTATNIKLSPISSGFPDGAASPVTTSPNQLAAMAVAGGRVYITSVSASPQGPTRFDQNVFPVVYVADLTTGAEVRDATGTANLARKVFDAIPTPSPTSPRFIPGELSDIAFLGNTNVAYAIGRAGDVMLRMVYGTTLEIGSTQNKEIDLGGSATITGCQAPTGLVVSMELGRAYVNCYVTRRLALVDLSIQTMTQTFEASPAPANAAEASVQRGKRFFFTGRARWSASESNGAKGGEGWSSCGSCHADGLTDNVTWVFGSGPRQTTSMDGTFSHGPGPQKQRILNWTAINDELHDFEFNVRGVSGGLGVIVSAADPANCNKLDLEKPVALTQTSGANIAGVGQSIKAIADNSLIATCPHKDWDDITAFVQTITPVHASKITDAQSVARGRQLFIDGGCAKCHGGSGWTVSNRFYDPLTTSATEADATAFAGASFTPPLFLQPFIMYNVARTRISVQPPIVVAGDNTGPPEANPVAVPQLACALRNVGTFGVPNDATATDALEVRPLVPPNTNPRAEGRAGYNVPSLYGLALGAPYLHHGQAATLTDLFTDARWNNHTSAGNANFGVGLTPGKIADLTAFLLSIDASTSEIALPADQVSGKTFDACLQ
jgi:YVTN family beta-propeller protein